MTETDAKSPMDMPSACASGKIRLYVQEPLAAGARLNLSPEQSHYVMRVMRSRTGDGVVLFNGRDGEWQAATAEMSKRSVTVEIRSRLREQDSVPDLTLLFAPVKRARLDFLVQKATELGVRVLRPVITQRTVVDRVNLERMKANVIEAAEQCGRLTVPGVLVPVKLVRLLADWPPDHHLLFCDEGLHERAPSQTVNKVLFGLEGSVRHGPWSVLIGPEGGFSPDERTRLHALPGAVAVGLGPRIMRADTAAMAALALWQAHLGDW